MKKLNYNVSAAIAMRGKTLSEIGWDTNQMHPKYEAMLIDFRTSIQICSNEAPNYHDYGNIPYHAEVLMGSGSNGTKWGTCITKSEWKRLHSFYRKYMRQCNSDYQSDYKNFAL